MMVVGLTGGIGSGKTTVARFFKMLGISIYIADDHAKRLMVEDPVLRTAIVGVLGSEAYVNGALNKTFIANQIFNDSDKLNQINNLVHPSVAVDFELWKAQQSSPYVIKEAAILFENGSYLMNDFNLLVVAPMAERLRRVTARDNASAADVRKRMNAQWQDAKKMALADAHIVNENFDVTKKMVFQIHQHLLQRLRHNV